MTAEKLPTTLYEWCKTFTTDDPVNVPPDLGGGCVRPLSYVAMSDLALNSVADEFVKISTFVKALRGQT